mmetsp:Transcript_86559/g.273179  ORF Transcript_86559/g.273179 Transcript_86559/m.273179 type:complete len:224 (-) Transcript_86559:80-751(-)
MAGKPRQHLLRLVARRQAELEGAAVEAKARTRLRRRRRPRDGAEHGLRTEEAEACRVRDDLPRLPAQGLAVCQVAIAERLLHHPCHGVQGAVVVEHRPPQAGQVLQAAIQVPASIFILMATVHDEDIRIAGLGSHPPHVPRRVRQQKMSVPTAVRPRPGRPKQRCVGVNGQDPGKDVGEHQRGRSAVGSNLYSMKVGSSQGKHLGEIPAERGAAEHVVTFVRR